MLTVALVCGVLVVLVTLVHYEALRLLSRFMVHLSVAHRAKLLVALLGAFVAHALEIALYALAVYGLARVGAGSLGGAPVVSWDSVLYFSAETYTSIGYGDLVPQGPLRLLAGVEALNGLLLIGWTSSFAYMAMTQYWVPRHAAHRTGRRRSD